MKPDTSLTEQLHELELNLIHSGASNSADFTMLLSDSFIEFGSSGRVYKSQALDATRAQSRHLGISQFELNPLSPDLAPVTYRAKHDGRHPVNTLRSSLWQKSVMAGKSCFIRAHLQRFLNE